MVRFRSRNRLGLGFESGGTGTGRGTSSIGIHRASSTSTSTSTSISLPPLSQPSISAPSPTFKPRLNFPLPSSVPSWYAGHMHRAIRSMPTLLLRHPPPLVIEARDSRLPITSINPAFDKLLRDTNDFAMKKVKAKGKGNEQGGPEMDWSKRRLVVYTKRDLIDSSIQEPLIKAFSKHGSGQEVMFVDTRQDKDVRKVVNWVKERAKTLSLLPSPSSLPLLPPSRSKRLAGAFRHTPTPETGIRLIILGMPNVGKSSLLNSLRRVGAGKGGKAAATAPHPGHTRKLMGTVRITPDVKHKSGGGMIPSVYRNLKNRELQEEKEKGVESGEKVKGEGEGGRGRGRKATLQIQSQTKALMRKDFETEEFGRIREMKKEENPVYVYDTPGVMVPFLGRGEIGAEKGVRLAVAAGIKSSLFDTRGLADYLLYRFNLRWLHELREWELGGEVGARPLPIYLTNLPLPQEDAKTATNSIEVLLSRVAQRAPGTLGKGGERDLDSTAEFLVNRWREGKLGEGELDLKLGEFDYFENEFGFKVNETKAQKVDRLVKEHFERVREAEEGEGLEKEDYKASDEIRTLIQNQAQPEIGKNDLLLEIQKNPEPSLFGDEGQKEKNKHSLPSLLSNHQFKKMNKIKALKKREDRMKETGKIPFKKKKKWGGSGRK